MGQLLKSYFDSWGWDPEGWLAFFVNIITKILLFLVGAFTFVFTSSIVASPFNDMLAEKTERYIEPPLPEVTEKGFHAQIKLIGIDLVKTVATGLASIIAILFSLIPIVNIFTFSIAFLLITFQFISYPQTRRGIGLKQGLGFLWTHLFASLGFGLALSFLFAVPFFSSFILPIAVVGGTLLVGRAFGERELGRLP